MSLDIGERFQSLSLDHVLHYLVIGEVVYLTLSYVEN